MRKKIKLTLTKTMFNKFFKESNFIYTKTLHTFKKNFKKMNYFYKFFSLSKYQSNKIIRIGKKMFTLFQNNRILLSFFLFKLKKRKHVLNKNLASLLKHN